MLQQDLLSLGRWILLHYVFLEVLIVHFHLGFVQVLEAAVLGVESLVLLDLLQLLFGELSEIWV